MYIVTEYNGADFTGSNSQAVAHNVKVVLSETLPRDLITSLHRSMKYPLQKNTKASTQSYRRDCHIDICEYQGFGTHHMQGQYTDVVFFIEPIKWHGR